MSRGRRGSRYGKEHERERARRLRAYHPGQPCAVCGQPMRGPTSKIHLAHTPDGHGYLGLAHDYCNTGQAGALTDYHGRRKDGGGSDPDPRPWGGW